MILKLRNVLFWMHLTVGVVAGLFILNMAVSGICLAYQKPITAFAERAQTTVVIPAGSTPLGVETVTAKIQTARPKAKLTNVTVYADPAAAILFSVGRGEGLIYANPYTGEVTGDGAKGVRAFFRWMETWHRWLALEGTSRPIGEAISGTVSIIYFAMLLSGLILWMPKSWPWSWARLRNGAILDLTVTGKARDWNWHNAVGLWCAPLILLSTFTAIVMAHTWASDLLYTVTGNKPPPHVDRSKQRGGGDSVEPLDMSNVNALFNKAGQKAPGWRSIRLSLPLHENANFTIDRADGDRPDLISQLALDSDSSAETKWQPYESRNAGEQARLWMRPIHTGMAAGIFGETLALIAALGGVVLVWTGLSLAYRRFLGRRNKAAPPSVSVLESASTP